MNAQTAQRTAGPWNHMPPLGEGNHAVLSQHVNANENFYVASCGQDADAAFIVRACNAHDELFHNLAIVTERLAAWMTIADSDDVTDDDRQALVDARAALAKVAP